MPTTTDKTTAPVLLLDWSEAEALEQREQEAQMQAEALERLFNAMLSATWAEAKLNGEYQRMNDRTTPQAAVLRQRMAAARQATADATYAWRCASC